MTGEEIREYFAGDQASLSRAAMAGHLRQEREAARRAPWRSWHAQGTGKPPGRPGGPAGPGEPGRTFAGRFPGFFRAIHGVAFSAFLQEPIREEAQRAAFEEAVGYLDSVSLPELSPQAKEFLAQASGWYTPAVWEQVHAATLSAAKDPQGTWRPMPRKWKPGSRPSGHSRESSPAGDPAVLGCADLLPGISADIFARPAPHEPRLRPVCPAASAGGRGLCASAHPLKQGPKPRAWSACPRGSIPIRPRSRLAHGQSAHHHKTGRRRKHPCCSGTFPYFFAVCEVPRKRQGLLFYGSPRFFCPCAGLRPDRPRRPAGLPAAPGTPG